MANIQSQLRDARLESRISIRKLAEKCEVDKMTISRIEKGEISPSIKTTEKIAEALGMKLKFEKL